MAADSSMGFHHQGITAAASVYNHHHHHMLSFQSSSGSDISMSGAGGGAGMGFATPRTMSGTSSTAGMYLSRNNNNHGGFGSAAVVGPSSRSSSGGGSTTASKYKFVTCSPSEWSDREQSILKEGLASYGGDSRDVVLGGSAGSGSGEQGEVDTGSIHLAYTVISDECGWGEENGCALGSPPSSWRGAGKVAFTRIKPVAKRLPSPSTSTTRDLRVGFHSYRTFVQKLFYHIYKSS